MEDPSIDYKKIIKNRSTRAKILRVLRFVPDIPMLRLQYWIKTGRWLHLRKPERFTEKLQWYKLYYSHPDLSRIVDKYQFKQYLESKGE